MKLLSKLDVYIIKTYLQTFVFAMLMITMVAICMNFFEHLDKFLSKDLTMYEIAFEYYLNFIPWINGLLWPLFALISVIFFTSRLAKQSEIISILASGVSYNRLLRPYIIAATFLAILLWVGNNYVIPNSTKIKNEFESEHIRRTKKSLSNNIHFFISPQEKVYFRLFSSRDSSTRSFRLETFEDGKLTKVLKASKLKFIKEPNVWQMKDYELRTIDDLAEDLVIKRNFTVDTIFPFHPDDFVRYSKQMEMLTSTDLRKFITEEQSKGIDTAKKYVIELYRRTAYPFTIIILTIIGVTVASRKVRGGMGLHLAVGVVIGSAFVILSKFSTTFATNLDLPPGLGVWIPNIVFSMVGLYLYLRAQK